ACLQAGASGITAIDSVGPTLRFDIEKRAPLLASGVGWLTGSAILPFSLRVVADIAMAVESGIVGTGGIYRVDDCVEMLMAGATAIGICSLPMVSGLQVFAGLVGALSDRLAELGYTRIQDAIGAGLPALKKCLSTPFMTPSSREVTPHEFFSFDGDLCVDCGACIRVCSYQARRAPDQIHDDRCRLCGLCASTCPTGALCLSREAPPTTANEGQDCTS
ncbi:4Fe-4S binding protein, partial [Candidatus Bipolaricaulota bacterium]|nr:4Fe-4S binding protein [Candidatus Bipolaricaulota bacterium]